MFDPATLLLITIAAGTILYGSYRSLYLPDMFKDSSEEIGANINIASCNYFRPKLHESAYGYYYAYCRIHCVNSPILLS